MITIERYFPASFVAELNKTAFEGNGRAPEPAEGNVISFASARRLLKRELNGGSAA